MTSLYDQLDNINDPVSGSAQTVIDPTGFGLAKHK
jgi:hypothetical protein